MNWYLNMNLCQGVDFGLESWENFDWQMLFEMVVVMIGKMGCYVEFYVKKLMLGIMFLNMEEFIYLIVLFFEKSLIKMELICYNVYQMIIGIEIIKCLFKKGFIEQLDDVNDKCSVWVFIIDVGCVVIFFIVFVIKDMVWLVIY